MEKILKKESGKEYVCPMVNLYSKLTEDVLGASAPTGSVGSPDFDNCGDSIDFN